MRHAVLAFVIATAFIRPAAALAEDRAPSLDLDVLSSVVAIEVDGKFAGTGVVVTRGGYVLTSYEFAAARLQKDSKRIVIRSDLPRAASVVAFDAKLGLAVLQMHGVIPRPATLVAANGNGRSTDLAVCRTADGATVQIEVRGRTPLPDCDICPVFTAKGKLKGVMISHSTDGGPKFLGIAAIRSLIDQ